MSHNAYIRTGGVWNTNQVVTHQEFAAFDAAQYSSLNADAGGTWAPAAQITIGGSGMQLVFSGGSVIPSTATLSSVAGSSVELSGSLTTFGEFIGAGVVDFGTLSAVTLENTVTFAATSAITQATGATGTFNGLNNFVGVTTMSDVTVSGGLTVGTGFTSYGNSSFSSTVFITGLLTSHAITVASGDISVTTGNVSILAGNLSCGGIYVNASGHVIGIVDPTTLSSTVAMSGAVTLSGTTLLSGPASLTKPMTASGQGRVVERMLQVSLAADSAIYGPYNSDTIWLTITANINFTILDTGAEAGDIFRIALSSATFTVTVIDPVTSGTLLVMKRVAGSATYALFQRLSGGWGLREAQYLS